VVVLFLLIALQVKKCPKSKPKCHIKLKPAPENCQCALEDFEPAVWNKNPVPVAKPKLYLAEECGKEVRQSVKPRSLIIKF